MKYKIIVLSLYYYSTETLKSLSQNYSQRFPRIFLDNFPEFYNQNTNYLLLPKLVNLFFRFLVKWFLRICNRGGY